MRRTPLAALASIALLALATLAAAPAAAEDSRWLLGLDFHSSHVGADDPTPGAPAGTIFVDEVGAGGALVLGYSFTPTFKLRLNSGASRHETSNPDVDVRLVGATLEAMQVFSPDRPFRPYLLGGLGGYSLESEQDALDFKTEGGCAVLAAGVYYFLGRHVALDAFLRGEWINWDKTTAHATLPGGDTIAVSRPVEESGAVGKFGFGLALWF